MCSGPVTYYHPHAPVDDPKGINSAFVPLLRSVTPFYTECPDKTSDSFRVSSMTLKDIPPFLFHYTKSSKNEIQEELFTNYVDSKGRGGSPNVNVTK